MSIFSINNNESTLFTTTFIKCPQIAQSESSNIDVTPAVIQLLKENKRKAYQDLATNFQSKQIPDWKTPCKNRVITIKNAVITPTGIIISPTGIWRMGGCVDSISFPKIKAMDFYHHITKTQPRYKKIVSIAALWSHGVWHFPMEALVGLKLIDNFNDTHVHISQKKQLCLDWINLVDIGIASEKIIDGNVFAEELILPEMGLCGNPYYEQLCWLKEKVHHAIPTNHRQNLFILIKRNAKRSVQNHSMVETICKNFCKKRKLEFYLHDDLFLPSLREQMTIFNRAKIIVGPHGAGGVNLLAVQKNTCFVEFINASEINICYTRMANLLNIDYFGITYSLSRGVDISKDLIPTLNKLDKYIN
jgi:hypothetical protein